MKKSEKKSCIISVSADKGVYRHIKIGMNKKLRDLSEEILYAFGFDDDHAHAFFMNNILWDEIDAYYDERLEDDHNTTDVRLSELGITTGMKFLYLFDFGDEWVFRCKVLKTEDTDDGKITVIKSVGEAPVQYPYYDESIDDHDENDDQYYDEDDEDLGIFEFPPAETDDILYDAAFRCYKEKPWKKLHEDEIFAVKLSSGETGYCNVLGRGGDYISVDIFIGQKGWDCLSSFMKGLNSSKYEINEMHSGFEYLITADIIRCEFSEQAYIDKNALASAKEAAGKRNITLRKYYPVFERYTPYHIPTPLYDKQEQADLALVLDAACYMSGVKSNGLIMVVPDENGFHTEPAEIPEVTEPVYEKPYVRTRLLPKKGTLECRLIHIPEPVVVEGDDIPVYPVMLAAVSVEDKIPVNTKLFEKFDAEKIARDFARCFKDTAPETILVSDDRTAALLGNICDSMEITLKKTQELPALDMEMSQLMVDLMRSGDEDDSISKEEFSSALDGLTKASLEELMLTLRECTPKELSMLPDELIWALSELPELPKVLKKKIDKALDLKA